MQEQLKPLTLQLARLKDLQVPEFGSLQAWEVVANATGTANGDSSAHDPYKSGGTSLPFLGEPKVCLHYNNTILTRNKLSRHAIV